MRTLHSVLSPQTILDASRLNCIYTLLYKHAYERNGKLVMLSKREPHTWEFFDMEDRTIEFPGFVFGYRAESADSLERFKWIQPSLKG